MCVLHEQHFIAQQSMGKNRFIKFKNEFKCKQKTYEKETRQAAVIFFFSSSFHKIKLFIFHLLEWNEKKKKKFFIS